MDRSRKEPDPESPDEADEAEEAEERDRSAEPAEEPRPEPAVTAPLDDVTEEEQEIDPVGVMPGAGPDPPDDLEGPGNEKEPDSGGPARRDQGRAEADPDPP
jgi:hypothetical protein